ncbi:translesion error-prone DNA polymerase V autoproteolytic subunit [Magnetovibrio sp.]|uniref:LexA family protein n=1 Tax=Magnetovibrio sp. TaxID=2024836 RepID=UPI002F93857D
MPPAYQTPPVWLSLGQGRAWRAGAKTKRPLPVLASPVRAGFPSPAEDYIEGSLDLNRHLIRHPAATFIVRVEGESMTGAGIFPGDLLVVDRSVEPHDGHVVIAVVEGELTVKRLKGRRGAWRLVAEHPDFPPIHLANDEEGGETSAIWGVVTNSVRNLSK